MQPRFDLGVALRPTGVSRRKSARTNDNNKTIASPGRNGYELPLSVERVFFMLRWMIIGLALAIMLYASSNIEDVVHSVQLAALVAIYNGMFSALRYVFPEPTTRVWLTVGDAFVIGLAVWLGNGVKSPFLVLFYLIIAEAALLFNTSNVLSYTALVSVIYVVAGLFVPGQKWSEVNITIIMSEILVMFIVASVSMAMGRALEQQRELARREKALSAQLNHQVRALSALNRLSEQLNSSLEIDQLMQNTVEVLLDALEVDACVALLATRSEQSSWQLGSVWCGLDEAFELVEPKILQPSVMDVAGRLIQAGPLILSETDWDSVLGQGQIICMPPATVVGENLPKSLNNIANQPNAGPSLLLVPLRAGESEVGALGLLRQNGAFFSQNDQELLAALGRQLSLLIRNARLYEMERKSVARLQELEQAKSDFLSAVSHELRTPLTSIKASTILLLSNSNLNPNAAAADSGSNTFASEAELTLLKNVDRNVDRLDGLVTDLLDMAKLQNGRLKLALQAVNLIEVVNDVVASLRPLTNRKEQELEVCVAANISPIMGDRRRLEQIVTNLLSNANRYTPRNGKLMLELTENNNGVRLTVSDTGPGIDPTEYERIFERFYRSIYNNGKSGTGLGLAIARSLTELHNGKLWVESTPGQGSTFILTLPVPSRSVK